MNLGGWIVMLTSVLGMTALLGWCIWMIVSHPGSSQHLHSPADIIPPDEQ